MNAEAPTAATLPDLASYAQEIRRWLLGRVSRGASAGAIAPAAADLEAVPRVLDWWVFEGKRYQGLDRPLASSWTEVAAEVRRLTSAWGPRWTTTESAAGEVDWPATVHAQLGALRPQYVLRASTPGLTPQEAAALDGWCAWVAQRWAGYVEAFGLSEHPRTLPSEIGDASDVESPDVRRLQRWAHTARRSRWPLLRHVVAESLRCTFEMQELNALPLPPNRDALFELLCAKRVMQALGGAERGVRWLGSGPGEGGNRIGVSGVRGYYQHDVSEAVREAAGRLGEPGDALVRHRVIDGLPRRIDLLFQFDAPRRGLAGILLEAKSGETQDLADTVWQLGVYRAALRTKNPEPLLVWGVAERTATPTDLAAALALVRDRLAGGDVGEDLWLFTTGDQISEALALLGLALRSQP
ncbi:MAG: hypothetical protein L6R30_00160 [Thermoanaerobaculia bacterium]|nr:hypothetical protein [Thermoanaerobaculia bacterium]